MTFYAGVSTLINTLSEATVYFAVSVGVYACVPAPDTVPNVWCRQIIQYTEAVASSWVLFNADPYTMSARLFQVILGVVCITFIKAFADWMFKYSAKICLSYFAVDT